MLWGNCIPSRSVFPSHNVLTVLLTFLLSRCVLCVPFMGVVCVVSTYVRVWDTLNFCSAHTHTTFACICLVTNSTPVSLLSKARKSKLQLAFESSQSSSSSQETKSEEEASEDRLSVRFASKTVLFCSTARTCLVTKYERKRRIAVGCSVMRATDGITWRASRGREFGRRTTKST